MIKKLNRRDFVRATTAATVAAAAIPKTLFGDPSAGSGQARPRLFQCCGTEDFLLSQNRALRDHLQPLGFDYLYQEGPGLHDWVYWDKMIARTLSWLPIAP